MSFDPKSLLERMASEVSPSPASPPPEMIRRARRRRVRSFVIAAVLVAATASGSISGLRALSPPLTVPPAVPAACSWNIVPSPNENSSTYFNALRKVAVVSDDDAWAIGTTYEAQEGGSQSPLILHWDGAAWTIIPNPSPEREGGLLDIVAISSDDVWAIGFASDQNGNGPYGLTQHWDGTHWSVVAAADPGSKFWHFEGVAAAAWDDVWAVGNTATGKSGGTLIEHWDGKAWTVVPSPSPQPLPLTGLPYATLGAVAVVSADDVWAVGEATNVAGAGASNTLVEHWDGSTWSVVPSPDVTNEKGVPFDHLRSVTANLPNDVWAVGIHGDRAGIGGGGDHVLIEHWDGASWEVVDSPEVGVWSRLWSVAASPDGVWAVGGYENESGSTFASLVEHWDGDTWSIVNTPAGPRTELVGVAIDPSGGVWAVGSLMDGKVQKTLVLRCGSA
jgi:hypothetical protein